MGLFSSKSSSSSTNVETTNVGFSEVEGPVTSIVGSNNVLTDQGAIEKAFAFAGQAQGAQTELVAGFGTQLEKFAAQSIRQEGDRMVEVIKWLAGAAALAVAVRYTFGGAKA